MTNYLLPLQTAFEANANPDNAAPMKKYMREQFIFLGIKAPLRKTLVKEFYAEHGLPPLDELQALVRRLWEMPYREYQYTAQEFLTRRRRHLTPDYVLLLEMLITTESWWDTVDGLAGHQVGGLFARFPGIRNTHIGRWRQQENLWLRRTTLLFQLRYKEKTDEDLLFALIKENLADKEFFIQKAIGWSLREYSKSNPTAVQQFVAATELSPLARREALKWMKNKGFIS
jgi:3-methyladenine DNA glycosylase AlkD